jgi:hypothetical protein
MRPWESLRRRATTGGTAPAASACPRVAGRAARRSLASGVGCSRRCKGIEIQPEARRIGATPKLVSGLIAVLQTQNPLGVVRWQVTRGRLALFAQVRLVAGHSGSVRSSRSGSLAADYARLVRVAHRSDWSAVDGKDACDRNPEPTQPRGGAWLAQAPGSLMDFLESHRRKNPASLHYHRKFCQSGFHDGTKSRKIISPQSGQRPGARSCPLEQVLVHVTYTVRGGRIRLISARRASRRETRDYERRKPDQSRADGGRPRAH